MEKWNEVTNRRISTSYALLQKKKKKNPLNTQQLPGNGTKIACSLPSVGDHSNILLEVSRSNHKK